MTQKEKLSQIVEQVLAGAQSQLQILTFGLTETERDLLRAEILRRFFS